MFNLAAKDNFSLDLKNGAITCDSIGNCMLSDELARSTPVLTNDLAEIRFIRFAKEMKAGNVCNHGKGPVTCDTGRGLLADQQIKINNCDAFKYNCEAMFSPELCPTLAPECFLTDELAASKDNGFSLGLKTKYGSVSGKFADAKDNFSPEFKTKFESVSEKMTRNALDLILPKRGKLADAKDNFSPEFKTKFESVSEKMTRNALDLILPKRGKLADSALTNELLFRRPECPTGVANVEAFKHCKVNHAKWLTCDGNDQCRLMDKYI